MDDTKPMTTLERAQYLLEQYIKDGIVDLSEYVWVAQAEALTRMADAAEYRNKLLEVSNEQNRQNSMEEKATKSGELFGEYAAKNFLSHIEQPEIDESWRSYQEHREQFAAWRKRMGYDA